MRVALDTNVLMYIAGVNDTPRQLQALATLVGLANHDVIIPAQVLGELYRALIGKARWSRHSARDTLLNWTKRHDVGASSKAVLLSASDLAVDHDFHIFDAIVVACASEERCQMLLSEDMQDGFTWGGVTIINPFAPTPHRLLSSAMRPS